MNILLVANWESDVGYAWWLMENFWVEIARHYQSQGRKCFLIYPKITKLPKAIENSDIVPLECDFSDFSKHGRARLRDIIRQNDIGSAYLTDRPYISFKYLFMRKAGVRRIVIHDHTPGTRTTPSAPKRIVKSAAMRLPLLTADHYIAVTRYVYDRFLNIVCLPKDKCSYASNGIVHVEPNRETRERVRARLGVDENCTVTITTGRASRYKGIDFIIQVADDLINRRDIRDLLFVHCGDGPDLEEFRSLVRTLNLEDRFLFLGKTSDVRDILQGCDVAIHASKGEVGYSLSILEYMDAGLLTFVPDRDSVSSCVEHEKNGLIYERENVRHAADLIAGYLQNSASASVIRANARKTVIEKYQLSQTNADLLKILDKVDF